MTVRSQFVSRFFFITVLFVSAFQCKMADLNNPSDPLSEEFAKQSVFAEFVRYLLQEKALPDALAVILVKSSVPYETGLRVYRVDNEIGVIDDYVSDVRTVTTAAFPGCTPYRIGVPPHSRDIITFTGSSSERVVVHRYGTDRSLSLLQDQPGIGTPRVMGFSEDGMTMYHTNTAANPGTINRWNRDPVSGFLAPNNVGSYPYAVGCSPVSVKLSDSDGIIFSATSTLPPIGINILKKTGPDSLTLVGGALFTTPDNPSGHENLCIIASKQLLYSTSANATNPIYGYRYDSSGFLSLLPNSPFSPDPSYSNHVPVANSTTSFAIDPTGNYAAFLYATGATYNIRLLVVDNTTGSLLQTNQKFTVGNGPKSLQWDKSGKFIYFVSDTGGTTNNYQIEYFKFSDGMLSKGENSPITISAITNGYAPQVISPIQKYYH